MLDTLIAVALWCSVPHYDSWRSKTVIDAQGCRERVLTCLKAVDKSVDFKSVTKKEAEKLLPCFENEPLK